VFPSEADCTVGSPSTLLHTTSGESATRKKRPPTILGRDALYSAETHRLKPVYGKPVRVQYCPRRVRTMHSLTQVDIVDNYGCLSTIAIWSYPLTTTAALIAQQRKQSAVSCMSYSNAKFPLTSPPHSDLDEGALRGRRREDRRGRLLVSWFGCASRFFPSEIMSGNMPVAREFANKPSWDGGAVLMPLKCWEILTSGINPQWMHNLLPSLASTFHWVSGVRGQEMVSENP